MPCLNTASGIYLCNICMVGVTGFVAQTSQFRPYVPSLASSCRKPAKGRQCEARRAELPSAGARQRRPVGPELASINNCETMVAPRKMSFGHTL